MYALYVHVCICICMHAYVCVYMHRCMCVDVGQQYFFVQNACYILTSKAQATYEVFHINIFLYN
jgi:hypothetical protein